MSAYNDVSVVFIHIQGVPMADQKSPVVTLTPSPTLDRTYFVKNLVEGGVNRAYEVGEELAGKG